MARIHVPDGDESTPFARLAHGPAADIVAAGFNFSAVTYARSKLTLREFEGARARTAEINGCRICRTWRSARDVPLLLASRGIDAADSIVSRGPEPEEAFYLSVAEWRTSPLYSPRERIAIEFAEGMGLDPQGLAADEDFWERAKALFSDEEIVDLSFCVACWMGLGRVGHVLGTDTVCAVPA